MESLMRRAADSINRSLARYDEKFPNRPQLDKLIFVALNEVVSALSIKDQAEASSAEIRKLEASLETYLKDIKDDR